MASLGKEPSSPVLVKGEVEGSGQSLRVPEEEPFAYAMNCPNAALNFHGIGVIGYSNLSDAFYERKVEERAEVFDKFYGIFSQELVRALKLEESILVPCSLHIYSQFINQIGYGSESHRLSAQMRHLMSVLGVRTAAVATGFLSTILEDREGLVIPL